MLYLFDTESYYTVYLHFTLTTTLTYAFHFNIICMYLYLHVFLFLSKNVNINFMLYLFSTRQYYITSLHLTLATTYAYVFYFNLIYNYKI